MIGIRLPWVNEMIVRFKGVKIRDDIHEAEKLLINLEESLKRMEKNPKVWKDLMNREFRNTQGWSGSRRLLNFKNCLRTSKT